jgi:hypothetical protein
VPLSQLFAFDSTYWESIYGCFAAMSFEDKLSMYALTDLEAHGGNNNSSEEGVDESTASEFINSASAKHQDCDRV